MKNELFDPGSEKVKWGNMNISGVRYISEDMYKYYIQTNDCLTCPVDKKTQEKCKLKCRLRQHYCNDESKIVVETASKPGWKYQFRCSRAELVYNYNIRFPFFLRTGKHFGVEMHHNNGNPLDDRFENIGFRTDHPILTGRMNALKGMLNTILELNDMINGGPERAIVNKLTASIKRRIKREIELSNGDSETIQYIIKEYIVKLALSGNLSQREDK